jgi:hypothetical protein
MKRTSKKESAKKSDKDIKELNVAVKRAKKEIREAEEATENAQRKVVDVATISKGKKKIKLTGAVMNLEKAANLATESRESTEEAEFKVKNLKK